ncbi:hypothetical protein [Marinobacterium rhizophilum]|uniref:hypothetical protein n=1 Tax=Marinobacterium rhizophilum TaxID=420402 RepID=UPI00036FAC84|nr:hypothetical protein [Marinobacterium rhizophilum]
MRGFEFEQSFPLTQIGTQCRNVLMGAETGAEQAKMMQPLSVVDIRLAARSIIRVASVDQIALKAMALQNFKSGYPVYALQRHQFRIHSSPWAMFLVLGCVAVLV